MLLRIVEQWDFSEISTRKAPYKPDEGALLVLILPAPRDDKLSAAEEEAHSCFLH